MLPPGSPQRLAAPAKVNLRLEVLGRRSDGLHELFTTFLALDWCDHLSVELSADPAIHLELSGPALEPDVPGDARNLVWRAALTFFENTGLSLGARLGLTKHLPSQAGLGGGSSDAAATYLALCAATGQGLEGVSTALASLGSDTVFFAAARDSGYAHGRGRGELIECLPLPPCASQRWFAVITPRTQAPTAAVYARLGLEVGRLLESSPAAQDWLALPLVDLRAQLFNGLERAAIEALPGVSNCRDLLDGIGLSHWRLAGSGSSFFGVYDDPSEAQADLDAVVKTAVALGEPLKAARLCRPFGSGPRALDGEDARISRSPRRGASR